MKYIITENRITNLIEKLIRTRYKDLKQHHDEFSKKIEWYYPEDDVKWAYPLFELNSSGTLFIPLSLKRMIFDLFSASDDDYWRRNDMEKYTINAFHNIYGINAKRVNIYFDL